MSKFFASLLLCWPIALTWANAASLPERGICAHRGASATHPENTLPAFAEAIRLGAHMIEFDVYLTKDDQPIIMHDATVNRTTDGQGKIAELTLAEIKRLDAGLKKGPAFKGIRVPTLGEALDVMPSNTWLNIHLKQGPALGRAVAQTLKQRGRGRQAVLACTIATAKAAREILPEVKFCCMDRQYGDMEAYVATAISAKADFIQLVGPLPANFPELIAKLKAQGIHINYFGIEDPDGLAKLFRAGVDFPLVNDVQAGLKVAANFGVR